VPGASVTLDASATNDLDGDKLAFSWWIFTEAGTYGQDITISDSNSSHAKVDVPQIQQAKAFM